jgi:hypothetical protein
MDWLTANAAEKTRDAGRRELLLFSGLAARLGYPYAASWMCEIVSNLMATRDVSWAVTDSLELVDWLAASWNDDGFSMPSRLLVLANRLHLLRFFTVGAIQARKARMAIDPERARHVAALLGQPDATSCDLTQDTQRKIEAILDRGLSLCRGEPVDGDSAWQPHWDEMSQSMWAELSKSP